MSQMGVSSLSEPGLADLNPFLQLAVRALASRALAWRDEASSLFVMWFLTSSRLAWA